MVRIQKDKDIIIGNLSNPFSLKDFIKFEEINHLIDLYYNLDKIHKNTGPIVSIDLKELYKTDPVLRKILKNLKKEIGECEIYSSFFFYVETPHIIHNDDDKSGPLIYKACTIPLELIYVHDKNKEDRSFPYLCFFDQIYLEGPSKFFNGSSNIPTYYNLQVYEYSKVLNLSSSIIDKGIIQKFFTHLRPKWLEGLSFKSAELWKPGNAIIFDCVRLHCASDFRTQGIKSKLGLSIFTKLT